jgi:hypothetical protein
LFLLASALASNSGFREMTPSSHPNQSFESRLIAQRNAAIAAAFLLAVVVVCAGWALERFPRRNAEIYRLQTAALSADLVATQQALSGTQKALVETQHALSQTELALRNTQQAQRQSTSTTR